MTRISSGISIREEQVGRWLESKNFKGEYLLVSTKSESVYYQKLKLLSPETKLVVDLYTPILLEKELTLSKWKPQDWVTRWRNKEMVRKFLRRGNHFLVANHRQRDYWVRTSKQLGVSVNRQRISVLPTGSSLTINHQPSTIHDRQVVLWFGGVYPWMDPLPLVKAFARIAPEFPNWKLRFLGGWHPATGYRGIYRKLEELGRQKIPKEQLEFIPWQLEKSLGKYLSDAVFAVHLVKPTLEDYYAHRVRLLTLLEAGIPVITGGRDAISDLIDEIGAGVKMDGSVESMVRELRMVMSNPKISATWKLQTSKMWKLLIKREYIPGKMA
ncbi:hypothetical protein HZB78_06260 [Candidatus Collierbacteria bacterium]|nr:hypothetical protein [Candidatus Collierbacteria bacterium]